MQTMRITLIVFLLAITIAGSSIPVRAADLVVGDGSAASCTESAFDVALNHLHDNGGGTLTFDCGGPATITFASEKLIWLDGITIDGGGDIILSGDDSTRLFRVDSESKLTLRNIVLTNAYTGSGHGAAVRVQPQGSLVVENSTIKDSVADGWVGAAIYNWDGSVRLSDCLIDNNHSSYGALNSTGELTLQRTTVSGNTADLAGGGFSVGAKTVIEDSTISGNQAPVGGAMFITPSGRVTVTRSTIIGNQAAGSIVEETGGGAILNDGWLNVTHSIFAGNLSSGSGGAVQTSYTTDDATTFLGNVTLADNQAERYGGATHNLNGVTTIVNSTISDNNANAGGGGVSNLLGRTSLVYDTVANNQGGNLHMVDETGKLAERQAIYLDRTAVAGGDPNCLVTQPPATPAQAYFVSTGYNLVDDESCAAYLGAPGDLNNAASELGPLTLNGGFGPTRLPSGESPLIDAATCSTDFFEDQRQVPRPQGALCDIGAAEKEGVPMAQISPQVYRLALDHLESLRGGSIAPNWDKARVSLQAMPLYRPDLTDPAYYEFPVEVSNDDGGYQPAGFIVVSASDHDYPIPHWSDTAESPSALLLRKASEQNEPAPSKFYKLDTLTYAAEDDKAQLVTMSNASFNKIILPAGPLPDVDLSRQEWRPRTTPPADDKQVNITYDFLEEGPQNSAVQLDSWASWAELKSDYAATYKPYLEHLQTEAGEVWQAVRAPIGLRQGEYYVLSLVEGSADVKVSGPGASFVTMEQTDLPGGQTGVILLANSAGKGDGTPFQVTISAPAETVDFLLLPPLYEQLLPMVTGGGRAVAQDAAHGPALPWPPPGYSSGNKWVDYYVGNYSDQRLYQEFPPGTAQNNTSCNSGLGPTAWAMLFGWADHQAYLGSQRWAPRWGIYRMEGGSRPQPDADAPRLMDEEPGVYNMIWDIHSHVGVICRRGYSYTLPWQMAEAQRYLFNRSYAWVNTRFNVFGLSDPALRGQVYYSLYFKHTPVIIGTGWLSQYALAWGYATETIAWIRTSYFKVNPGYSSNIRLPLFDSSWVSASTWFTGEVNP